jgi:hypothetical protein
MAEYKFRCTQCAYTVGVDLLDDELDTLFKGGGVQTLLEEATKIDDHHRTTKATYGWGHRDFVAIISGDRFSIELLLMGTEPDGPYCQVKKE